MLTIRNQIPTLQNPTLGSAFDIGIFLHNLLYFSLLTKKI